MDFMALFTSPSFWFDIICIVLLFMFCARYVRLGLLSALVQIFGTVLSVVGAHLLATTLDGWVYKIFFAPGLEKQVEVIVSETSSDGIEALSSKMLTLLPEGLQNLWADTAWFDAAEIQMNSDISVITESIMQSAVEPIVTQIIFMILFFLGFILCRFLVFLLVKLLRVANYIPVLGTVNRVLGWAFGTVGGCIDMFLALCVLWLFMLLTDDIVPVLNSIELADSMFYQFFEFYNPFV